MIAYFINLNHYSRLTNFLIEALLSWWGKIIQGNVHLFTLELPCHIVAGTPLETYANGTTFLANSFCRIEASRLAQEFQYSYGKWSNRWNISLNGRKSQHCRMGFTTSPSHNHPSCITRGSPGNSVSNQNSKAMKKKKKKPGAKHDWIGASETAVRRKVLAKTRSRKVLSPKA